MSACVRCCAVLVMVSLAALGLPAGPAYADYVYTSATAHDTGGGNDFFDFGTGLSIDTVVVHDGSYEGLATQVTGLDSLGSNYLGSKAVLLAGVNTGPDTTVSMTWRNRTGLEGDGPAYGGVSWPGTGITQYAIPTGGTAGRGVALAYDSYVMTSDVLSLEGLQGTYVLQMNYDEVALMAYARPSDTEEYYDSINRIYLGWFETTGGGALPGYDEWVNAVDGNSGTGLLADAWFKGSFDQFVLAQAALEHPDVTTNLGLYLGSFGCDTDSNTAWAVLDHNSQFGVVPEPASLSLVALGGLALWLRRRRK